MPSISLVSVKRRPAHFTLGHTCASTYTEFPLDRFTVILQPSSNTAPSPLFAKDAENQLQAKREAAEHVAGTADGVKSRNKLHNRAKSGSIPPHFLWPVRTMRL